MNEMCVAKHTKMFPECIYLHRLHQKYAFGHIYSADVVLFTATDVIAGFIMQAWCH